ncbi:MAG: cytochrome c [Alcaligenaceae bacterium]|nr:cytochrome c [Alcaligenaceae bacterium]
MTKQPLKRSITALAIMTSCAFALPAAAQQAAPAGDIEAAKGKISMCIGCHGIEGYRASFPEVYSVPKIAGQNAEYIVTALKDYKSGARSFPSMYAIAHSLSDQDILDLAAYYSQLK